MTTSTRIRTFLYQTTCLALALLWASDLPAQEEKDSDRLRHVDSVTRDDLQAVCNVNLSPDGKYLYAAAWQANCVSGYRRDPETGRLEHLQSIVSEDYLQGVTSVRLSSDGRYAVAAAFRSKAVVLSEREPFSGKLQVLHIVNNETNPELRLSWPIDAVFSPDNHFVYLLDPKQSGAPREEGEPGSIVVFRLLRNGKLELVENNRGRDKCFHGCRGMAFHPDGKLGFVACANSSQLVVVERDPESGKLTVLDIIEDGSRGASALEGVIGVVCSPDGRHVYASSGRFRGDNAVTVFQIDDTGSLSFLQDFSGQRGELQPFVGGNEIKISPDGRYVYATGTRSSSLVSFRRDPETGALTPLETLADANFLGKLGGAAASEVSPDGRFVYVAAEFAQSIEILERAQ